jgi:hypothetical protein
MDIQPSGGCKWCKLWQGQPDMAVDIAEVAGYMVPARLVGAGAFANVYSGCWRGQQVAIKVGAQTDTAFL